MICCEELAELLRETGQGVTLPCRVQPRSSRSMLGEKYGEAVKIYLTSPPVDGKANEELCKFLAKQSGLPRSSVRIHSGETSRTKVILFAGAEKQYILEHLCP